MVIIAKRDCKGGMGICLDVFLPQRAGRARRGLSVEFYEVLGEKIGSSTKMCSANQISHFSPTPPREGILA